MQISVYRVIIDRSTSQQENYVQVYVGNATSEGEAVEEASQVFGQGSDYRIAAVEVLDRQPWAVDAVLPPDGDARITS
jgi:hypothetical protein